MLSAALVAAALAWRQATPDSLRVLEQDDGRPSTRRWSPFGKGVCPGCASSPTNPKLREPSYEEDRRRHKRLDAAFAVLNDALAESPPS